MESTDKTEVTKSLLFSVLIGLWLYWLWTRRHFYAFSIKFPGYFGAPIIGVLGKLISSKNLITFGSKIFKETKLDTILIWFGLYPVLLTIDPDLIEDVLSSPELLNKSKTMYHPIYKAVNYGGILASPVKEWEHNRKMVKPSFQHKVLLSMFPVFNKNKNWVISKLNTMERNDEHNLAEVLRNLFLRTTVETTMGKIMNDSDQVADNLTEIYDTLFEKILQESVLAFLNLGWVMNLNSKYRKARRNIHNYVNQLILEKICEKNNTNAIDKKRQILEQSNVDFEDTFKKSSYIFIDQAIDIFKNKQFSWNDIIAESNTIVAASFDTSANVLFSTLVMLAMHPEVQERLYEEIINVFPEKSFDVQYEHCQQLPFLDMVIKEVLRLVPPAPVIGRHVVKKTQLSKDLVVPKDIQILISIFHLHRSTDIWGPNADKFDPERFLPTNMIGKHPYAYIPFSKGKRNCIGWRYADLVVKTVLSGLIRNFRFTTSYMFEDLEFIGNVTLKYINEPMFQIHDR